LPAVDVGLCRHEARIVAVVPCRHTHDVPTVQRVNRRIESFNEFDVRIARARSAHADLGVTEKQ
jgi:hypothetical protein